MNDRLRPWLVISRRTISSRRRRRRSKIASMVACDSPVRTRSAEARAAEQQPDGLDEDRFARSGLAGQDVEARLELDLDGLDHREVADAEKAEHAGGTSIVSYV